MIISQGDCLKFILHKGNFVLPTDCLLRDIGSFWLQKKHLFKDVRLRLPPFDDIQGTQTFTYVGEDGNQRTVVELNCETLNDSKLQQVTLRELLMVLPEQLFAEASRAWQYSAFLQTHQFCGRCGGRAHQLADEMATHCDACHHRCYPRVSPCIIVSIRHQNQILLAQGVRHQKTGFFSTLAGFVESAESLEQAVHREVFEEVGIKVKNVRYFDSQAWPFPHSLMCGFLADYAGGELNPDPSEILSAHWFEPSNLPKTPPKVSIAGRLIEATLQEINENMSSQ